MGIHHIAEWLKECAEEGRVLAPPHTTTPVVAGCIDKTRITDHEVHSWPTHVAYAYLLRSYEWRRMQASKVRPKVTAADLGFYLRKNFNLPKHRELRIRGEGRSGQRLLRVRPVPSRQDLIEWLANGGGHDGRNVS